MVVNPRREPAALAADEVGGATLVHGRGASIDGTSVLLEGFGHAVLALATPTTDA